MFEQHHYACDPYSMLLILYGLNKEYSAAPVMCNDMTTWYVFSRTDVTVLYFMKLSMWYCCVGTSVICLVSTEHGRKNKYCSFVFTRLFCFVTVFILSSLSGIRTEEVCEL